MSSVSRLVCAPSKIGKLTQIKSAVSSTPSGLLSICCAVKSAKHAANARQIVRSKSAGFSGSESEAHLRLPAATFKSRIDQLVADQVGQVDYWIKSESAKLRNVLATVQEVRAGASDAVHRSGR